MSGFFDGIGQETISFHGFTGKAPMFFREVRMMGGVFTCDLAAARALMPTPDHRPLRVWPERGVAAVQCLEYADTDIGPYNEVSLSIAIAHGRGPCPSWGRLACAGVWGRYHAFVVDLPVTTEAACHGGVDILGFPKWIARIDFTDDGNRRVCVVRDGDDVVVRVTGDRIRTRDEPREISLESYPRKDGATLHAAMRMRMGTWGASMLSRRMTVEPGSGPRASAIRSLALGRQIDYVYAPRCEAILFRPETIG